MAAWDYDYGSRRLDASPELAAIFGLAPGSGIATLAEWQDRVHPEDRSAPDFVLWAEAVPGRCPSGAEYRILVGDGAAEAAGTGAVRWVSATGTIVRDGSGQPIRAVGILRDVTEQRRVAGEREAALRGRAEALQELSHRVKNSLQVVASMIRLQASRAPEGPVRRAMTSLFDRIAAISDAHARMYMNGAVGTLDLGVYVEDLCGRLGQGASREIPVSVAGTPVQLEADRAVPLGLVVSELVSAAMRGAEPGKQGEGAWPEVALNHDAGGCRLTIRGILALDDQPGVDGLGLTLVRLLVRQAEADLILDRTGARIILTLPDGRSPAPRAGDAAPNPVAAQRSARAAASAGPDRISG